MFSDDDPFQSPSRENEENYLIEPVNFHIFLGGVTGEFLKESKKSAGRQQEKKLRAIPATGFRETNGRPYFFHLLQTKEFGTLSYSYFCPDKLKSSSM